MSRRKKILIVLPLVVLVIIGGYFYSVNNMQNKSIDRILEQKAYSYLPVQAKDYIKQYYNETGEILLTEKNKKENTPYLNPSYVDYLSVNDKEEYGYIPPEIIVDYVFGTSPSSEQFPSSFDLRNVNGKNYVTPVQKQYGGLCWAYSSTAQIEGLLLLNSEQSYSDSATIFSERQLDYATSKDGIIDNKTMYPYRFLHDEGGAYNWPWSVEVDGLGLASIDWEREIGDSIDKLEANKVYSFNNSLYEVDNTVYVPNLNLATLDSNSEEDMNKREEYLNTIKNIIKNYGGAVVGSIDPKGKCTIPLGNSRLIYNNKKCVTGGGHAMQIIGWDDDYEYSFCKKTNSISSDISSCSQSNIVNGKGVWILKNSWGENNTPYPYLAYDNYDLTISAVKSVDIKKWDNYYYVSTDSAAEIATAEKVIENDEKINKIKLNISAGKVKNEKLDIYIASNDNNFQLIGSIDTDLPGYYTLNLSDKNIMFNNKMIKIKAMYGNSSIRWYSGDDVRVYTNNVNENAYIRTEDYVYDEKYSSNNNYEIRLEQITRGIPENSAISYKILDEKNNEIAATYTYSENTVYANKIYPKIIIDSSLKNGQYKIQSLYNNEIKSESNLIINSSPVVINGNGSKQEPYIITNPSQLNLIRKNKMAYYKLGNDIDLSYDTQNENGLFYNNGLGWEPIECSTSSSSEKFSGSFDGNGYRIKGLYINRPDENYVGLFKNIYSYGEDNGKQINIVNLILQDPNITGNNYVGGIAGNIDSQTSLWLTNLQNIFIIGGNIAGNNYVGGIAGNFRGGVDSDKQSNRISSLFNSSSISANNYAGGLFGSVENTHIYSGMNVYIKNILNIGNVSSKGNASGLIGNVKMRHEDPINIENAINAGIIKGVNCSNGITCALDSEANGTLNLKNIYYIDEHGYDITNSNINSENVKRKVGNTITDLSDYNEWDSFSKYWKSETINDIARVPLLKNFASDYTSSSIDKIMLNVSQKINVSNTISSDNNLTYTIIDDSIASINDGEITGKKIGMTYLIASTKYEQLIIPIYITSQDEYNISFDANGGNGTMETLNTALEASILIPTNNFTKTGYKFTEWNTKPDGTGDSYKSGQTVLDFLNSDNNIELYAQWQPIEYTVIFNSNDYNDGTEEQKFTYGLEENLLSNPFTDNGLKFISWNTKPDGSGTDYMPGQSVKNLTTEENGVINLYAIWESYKISFDANGGNGKMNNVIYNVGGDDVQLPENLFTKPGYLFKNWNTKSNNSGTIYYHGDFVSVNEDMTLYAIWTPIKYNIYLYNTENEIVGAYLNRYYDKEYIMDNGQEQFALKQGYKFKEWNTKINGTGDSYKAGDTYKNLSSENNFSFNLYSILSPIIYKIKFDSNGGVGDMDDKVLTYDVSDSLSKNIFKNGNHRFKEWNTKADGSGTSYQDEQDVKNLTDTDNDVITLYAIWEEDTGLKYDYNEDGIIDLLDVKQLFRIYMITTDRKNEEFISKHDLNGDGIVDLLDVKQFFRLVMLGTYD